MIVVDNFLSQNDWDWCLDYFKGGNWCFPPLSGQTNKTCVWRIFDPSIEANVGEMIYNRLAKMDIPPLSVKRVGINGSTTFNESHIHIDGPPGHYTLVWFGTPEWNYSWDGHLQIYDDEDCWKNNAITKTPDVSKGLQLVEYIPNRAVLFPSHLAHIPQTPSISAKNHLRISVGLHLQPADNWNFIYTPRT